MSDLTSNVAQNRDSYWNTYYGREDVEYRFQPSQFAAFVLGELKQGASIIELGCGTGRDAFFFAFANHNVVGVDKSHTAIAKCQAAKENLNDSLQRKLYFIQSALQEPELFSRIEGFAGDRERVLYSRFFLHAITDAEEEDFLRLVKRLCRPGERLVMEFRTLRDSEQKKMTGSHFRRFLDPLTVMQRCVGHGFSVKYFVEGFGFAKHGVDDAHVARFIMEKEA